jgi:hypothetical protein
MDYARRRRFKLWGTAWFVEGDAELVQSLMPDGYRAQPEQVFMFSLSAWDANCPQHIPQRFEAADVAAALEERDRRIAELTQKVKDLEAAGRAAKARFAPSPNLHLPDMDP